MLCIILANWVRQKLRNLKRTSKIQNTIIYAQLLLIIVSCVLVYYTSVSLQKREGLPKLNQAASWTIIGISKKHNDSIY